MMVSVRILCGVAALGVGIVAGMVLYKGPAQARKEAERAEIAALQSGSAIDFYTAALEREPKSYIYHLRRGLLLRRDSKDEQALEDFTAALRLSPPVMTAEELGARAGDSTHPETHRLTLARQLHTERALALQALGRTDEALADLDAAVALDARDMQTHYQRGVIRTYAGRIKDAVTDFNLILDRAPNADALIGRANARYLGGDYAGSAADFTIAMRNGRDQGRYAVWLLKAQLRGKLAIPLKQFEALPKDHPAWTGINALLADYTPAQMAASLAAGMTKDKKLACDGMVFLGEWLVIKASGENAPAVFKDALDVCRPGTMPHAVATLELRRLTTALSEPAALQAAPAVPAIMRTPAAAGGAPGI